MEMTIDEALRKGTEAHDAGDIQLADSCFTAILKAQPTHPDANHNLGVIAVQTGKPEQAIDFFNRAVEGNPSNTLYWLHYIKTLKNIYRVNEAKEILDQAKKNGLSGGQLSELERDIDKLILDGTIFPNDDPPSEQSQFLLDIYNKGYVVAGVATGAIGIGVLVADILNAPFIYVRPQPKSHGRQNQIEGQLESDQKVLVIEDLISTGKSSLNAVNALKKEGVEVLGMLGLFDYGFDLARENFKAEKIQLYTLSDYNNLIIEAEQSNYIKAEEISLLKSWRVSPSEWQPY